MRIYRSEVPLVPVCLIFVSGMVLYRIFQWQEWYMSSYICAGTLFLVYVIQARVRSLGAVNLAVILLALAIFSVGYSTAQLNDPTRSKWHVSHHLDSLRAAFCTAEKMEESPGGYALHISFASTGTGTTPLFGKGIIYLRDELPSYEAGMMLFVEGNWQSIEFSGTPGVFNYARYCRDRYIYARAYLDVDDIQIIATPEKLSWPNRGRAIRKRLEGRLETYILHHSTLGLSKAMTLGLRRELDREQQQLYRQSGTAHILAVSGLHVGIVYTMLVPVVSRLRLPGKWSERLKYALPFIGIWTFVWICGLPPSAVRAASVCSFFIVGKFFGWRAKSLNLLALSCLVILVAEPNWLWHVGFQFSYLAMIGILSFYPLFSRLYKPSFKPLSYMLDAVYISMAAQILLIPLSIFYFHYVTPYFLIHSVTSIIFAYLALSLSLLILATGTLFPFASHGIAKLLTILTINFERLLQLNEHLPANVIDGLNIPLTQLVFIYLALFSIAWWAMSGKSTWFISGLVALALCSILANVHDYRIQNRRYVALLPHRQNLVMLYVNGKNGHLISNLPRDKKHQLNFTLDAHCNYKSIQLQSDYALNQNENSHPDLVIDDGLVLLGNTLCATPAARGTPGHVRYHMTDRIRAGCSAFNSEHTCIIIGKNEDELSDFKCAVVDARGKYLQLEL